MFALICLGAITLIIFLFGVIFAIVNCEKSFSEFIKIFIIVVFFDIYPTMLFITGLNYYLEEKSLANQCDTSNSDTIVSPKKSSYDHDYLVDLANTITLSECFH